MDHNREEDMPIDMTNIQLRIARRMKIEDASKIAVDLRFIE
jgi:hypothetical protein